MNLEEVIEKYGFILEKKCSTYIDYCKTQGEEQYCITDFGGAEFDIYVRDFVSCVWVELGFLNSNLDKLIKFLDLLED